MSFSVLVYALVLVRSPPCMQADALKASAVRSRCTLERGFHASWEMYPHFTTTAFLSRRIMPPARNIDIKLLFDPCDMTPGPSGRKFRRDLLLASGKTDTRGWSLADCFLRIDEGAVL